MTKKTLLQMWQREAPEPRGQKRQRVDDFGAKVLEAFDEFRRSFAANPKANFGQLIKTACEASASVALEAHDFTLLRSLLHNYTKATDAPLLAANLKRFATSGALPTCSTAPKQHNVLRKIIDKCEAASTGQGAETASQSAQPLQAVRYVWVEQRHSVNYYRQEGAVQLVASALDVAKALYGNSGRQLWQDHSPTFEHQVISAVLYRREQRANGECLAAISGGARRPSEK